MRRGFFGIAIGVALFAACGDATFQGAGDDTSSQDGGSDASDASIDAPLLDAASDAGPDSAFFVPGNLLADPSFEDPVLAGCGENWSLGGNTTLMLASVGRTGGHSCFVCGIGNYGALATNPAIEPLAFLDAGTYQGSAWVMPIDSDAGPPSPFALPEFSQAFVDGGSNALSGNAFTTPVGQWTQVYFDAILDSDMKLQFTIAISPESTSNVGCALMDDFSLVAE